MVSLLSKTFAKVDAANNDVELYECPDSSAGTTMKEVIVSNTSASSINFDIKVKKKGKDIITIIPTTTLAEYECNVIDLNTILNVGDKFFINVDTANVADVMISYYEP